MFPLSRSPAPTHAAIRSVGTCVLFLAMVALGSSAITGCGEDRCDKCSDPPIPCLDPDCVPPSSLQEVLEALRQAYAKRYLDHYARLFADDFAFYFDPSDSSLPGFPRSWDRAHELACAARLFQSDTVDRIVLDWEPGTAVPSPEVLPSTWRVRVRLGHLQILRRDLEGRRDTLEVPGGTQLFYLRPDPSRPSPSGLPSWYIVRWEDLGNDVAFPKAEQTNWSVVKYLYRG
jgi:hypothetical protein